MWKCLMLNVTNMYNKIQQRKRSNKMFNVLSDEKQGTQCWYRQPRTLLASFRKQCDVIDAWPITCILQCANERTVFGSGHFLAWHRNGTLAMHRQKKIPETPPQKKTNKQNKTKQKQNKTNKTKNNNNNNNKQTNKKRKNKQIH